MKETQIPDLDNIMINNILPKADVLDKIEKIYIQALNEIIRQVSVQSKARGDLISYIIDTLKFV